MKKLLKEEAKLLEVISDIYIFIMILLFPLLVDKTGYFHIFECKWNSYLIITSIYIIVSIIIILYYLFFRKTNIFKAKKLSIVQYLAFIFLLINFISLIISPFLNDYNLFYGVGRGEGIIVMSLYTLSFVCVSLFTKFKKRFFIYFSITSILISLIAILQYLGFNPFNLYQEGIGIHNVSFVTTIGNIDFVSEMYCVLLPISFCSYVFLENEKYEKIIHLLSLLMGFIIIGIINVLSGKVAFICTLLIILPFIVLSNKRLSKFLIALSAIVLSCIINMIIIFEYHYDIQKMVISYKFNYIILIFIIAFILLILLSYFIKNINYDYTNNKKLIKRFYIIMFIIFFFFLLSVYFIGFNEGLLYELHEILHGNFDDKFGTYRIFLWKRTLNLISEYPLLGTGPDTFAIRFMAKYSADVASIGTYTINDTAANVYLTMIINIGLVGLISYLFFIVMQIKNGIKKMNKYSIVFLISIVCYLIQDFFNISLVIVTPLFWLVMALHHNCINVEKCKYLHNNIVKH